MSFNPATKRIEELGKLFPERISELEKLFDKETILYIDYGNVFHWFDKMKWHLDLKRLKQLLSSFPMLKQLKFYYGTMQGNPQSILSINEIRKLGYDLTTKDVKVMNIPIDVRSIPEDSTDVLKNFINKDFLAKLKIEDVKYLNRSITELNKSGITKIEQLKCNFDVEISVDMILDCRDKKALKQILWSGDSDFADIINKIRNEGNEVLLFGIAGRVSPELSGLKIYIYDIKKMKNFICRSKEIPTDVKDKLST